MDEVYREKNFTRAAEKLFITQPALIMAIQKAEEKLGMPIFDRSTRPLSLTEAGQAYLQHILNVRQLEMELDQQIQDIKKLDTGKITIGGSHYLNACILPSVLARFMAKYPKVEVILKEASSAELSEKLAKQEIDLTFHCSPEFIQDFERYPAFYDHILLAVPKEMDHLAKSDAFAAMSAQEVKAGRYLEEDCRAVPLAAFRDLPFILLSKGDNLYERSRAMFEEAGFEPRTKMNLTMY